MDLDELNLDIKIEVTSVEELREIRKELQKIAKSKKEIEITEDGVEEVERPEETVDTEEAMTITGRDDPEAAQKTLEYETRKARSELDRVTVDTLR